MSGQAAIKGTSVREFIAAFPDEDSCRRHLFMARTGNPPACPSCGDRSRFFANRKYRSYTCASCSYNFRPAAGTIFHHSRLPLHVWFYAMLIFCNSRNGVSASFLQRHLGIAHKAAWRMADRIRMQMVALQDQAILGGPGEQVEIDETLVTNLRNAETGGSCEAIVFGLADSRRTYCEVVPDRKRSTLFPIIRRMVHPQSTIVTDCYSTYRTLPSLNFQHIALNHSQGIWSNREGYSMNHIETYWACLKRFLRGTHSHVDIRNLDKYIQEYGFRYNHRHDEKQTFWSLIERFPVVQDEALRHTQRSQQSSHGIHHGCPGTIFTTG